MYISEEMGLSSQFIPKDVYVKQYFWHVLLSVKLNKKHKTLHFYTMNKKNDSIDRWTIRG